MAYLKLEYWDSCDIGGMIYQFGYKNVMYLDVDVGTPTIEVVEEGAEDGDKNFITFWKKMIKSYKFFIPIPEYQFDTLTLRPS